MIVNLRGTNGSGKSTVARGLIMVDPEARIVYLAEYKTEAGAERWVPGYHVPKLDLVVVGPYRTDCGGCDAIKTQALVKEAVRKAASLTTHVLFEGVIVSTLFSGYLELSKGLVADGRTPLAWCYLDTPVEECLRRIQVRNGGKPIKEDLVRQKVRAIEGTRRKAQEAGEEVRMVNHQRALEEVRSWLS
jgi:thymidylate kinase